MKRDMQQGEKRKLHRYNGKGMKIMTKQILMDYIDACELIKETEEDIRRLRKKEVVQDKVSGSNPEFPYQRVNFNVSGIKETHLDKEQLKKEKELLKNTKKRAEKTKIEVEEWMDTIPLRMQRIIRYKIFERKSWEEVAIKMGENVTADSIRMEYNKFIKKQK